MSIEIKTAIIAGLAILIVLLIVLMAWLAVL